jgi:hypothetical protein
VLFGSVGCTLGTLLCFLLRVNGGLVCLVFGNEIEASFLSKKKREILNTNVTTVVCQSSSLDVAPWLGWWG